VDKIRRYPVIGLLIFVAAVVLVAAQYGISGGTPLNQVYLPVVLIEQANQNPLPPTLTPTPTPPTSSTPSPTPISFGANIASRGCATAFFQNSPSSPIGNDPNLATDGSFGTEWNAGTWTQYGNPLIWQWSLPAISATCADGRVVTGLPDSQDQIEGFQLIPDQSIAGTTVHELWLYTDASCIVNINSSNTAYFTWNGDTSAGEVLPLKVSPPLFIRCVIVRTLADPSFVAWEEVQIYQALPPPSGGFATATPIVMPSPTATPTPSLTPLPPVTGVNIAPFAGSIYSDSNAPVSCVSDTPPAGSSQDPCAAIDNVDSTAWSPVAGSSDPQGLTVNLGSAQFNPATDVITDIRVLVLAAGGSSAPEVYQVTVNGPSPSPSCTFTSPQSGYPDFSQLDCPFAIPILNVTSVTLTMLHDGVEDGTYGVREFQVYKLVSGFPTGTVTTTATMTPTPSVTVTFTTTPTCTATLTPTRSATVTSTSTSGADSIRRGSKP
jgi:hypothetical protein